MTKIRMILAAWEEVKGRQWRKAGKNCLVNNLKSDEDLELQKKKITTDNIIHVSSVEFHEELNGTTPGAVKVGPKKRTQKNCKIQPKTG